MSENLSDNKSNFPFVPLPDDLVLPRELEDKACPWLVKFIKFSKKWRPRSYDGYYVAVGLWVLSTVAANRVHFHLGKRRSTSLQIILVGRTSIAAKSSAANIGLDILIKADLDWLLLPGTCTPQKLKELMVAKLPADYNKLAKPQKERAELICSFAGQRGWFFDEFGFYIQGMMNPNGSPLSDFRTLLRKMDDCDDTFESATVTRGIETIKNPYLSLLACLTPADLVPYTKKGTILWNDGFLARMALVAAPDDFRKHGEFPDGERIIPKELINEIIQWHKRLGLPQKNASDSDTANTNFPSQIIQIPKQIKEQFSSYGNFLGDLIADSIVHDLDGSYTRFPEKAMRIAVFLASFENKSEVELCHWALARKITEDWRKDLHNIYNQITSSNIQIQRPSTDMDKIIMVLRKRQTSTSRELLQYTSLSKDTIKQLLDQLIDQSKVKKEMVGKTVRYSLEQKSESVT